MPRKALIEKAKKTPKFPVRQRNRCFQCGRARGLVDYKKFHLCRFHVREQIHGGFVYGFRKKR